MLDRERRISDSRQHQPIEELRRKADKAINRANLWTQEEIDFAFARAREMGEYFHRPHIGHGQG